MIKKRIIIASGNNGKIKEIADILNEYQTIGYKSLGYDFEVEETGSTFYENALLKAQAVMKATGEVALADDSGLVVNALGGAPGIYSARYSGDGDSEHNMDLLLKNMQGVCDRSAKFVCCIVACFPNGKVLKAEGETLGKIEYEKKGSGGFGYDPIFFSSDLNKCFGLCSEQEKNSVSHRFRALSKMKELLKNEL